MYMCLDYCTNSAISRLTLLRYCYAIKTSKYKYFAIEKRCDENWYEVFGLYYFKQRYVVNYQ